MVARATSDGQRLLLGSIVCWYEDEGWKIPVYTRYGIGNHDFIHPLASFKLWLTMIVNHNELSHY